MANLDTTSKRRSSVQYGLPPVLAALLADGAIAQGDRQHIALMYSGILATGAVAVVPVVTRSVAINSNPSDALSLDSNPSDSLAVDA